MVHAAPIPTAALFRNDSTVNGGASGTAIGAAGAGNVIGGGVVGNSNSTYGAYGAVWIDSASNTTIQGNRIGVNQAGTAALLGSTTGYGIRVTGASKNVTVGGTGASEGNQIAGFSGVSLRVEGTFSVKVDGVTVQGNLFGTNATGTGLLGSEPSSISIADAKNVAFGGTTAAARNIVMDTLYLTRVSGGTVQGNSFGVAANGTMIGPATNAVTIDSSANVLLGGSAAGARNLIVANHGLASDTQSVLRITGANSNVAIQGNFIGHTGISYAATNNGIYVTGASGVTIGGPTAAERNVIAGTARFAHVRVVSSTGVQIAGNDIGLDPARAGFVFSSGRAIWVQNSMNTVIGGATSTAGTGLGNVIAGHALTNFTVSSSLVRIENSTGTAVAGNLIGLNAGGTAALGSNWAGVVIVGGSNNTIGGTDPLARNVIAGQTGKGPLDGGIPNGATVFVDGAAVYDNGSTGTKVLNNYIGTDITGNNVLGVYRGVVLNEGTKATVGGIGVGNVIAGYADAGVRASHSANNVAKATNHTISGNKIGLNAAGQQVGIGAVGVVLSGVTNNVVGGLSLATGNVIVGNAYGVQNSPNTGNAIRYNLIYNNPIQAIQNALWFAQGIPGAPPAFAVLGGQSARVVGSFVGQPLAQYAIDFYTAPTAAVGARTYLTTLTVNTDSTGVARFDTPLGTAVAFRTAVVANATRVDTGTSTELSPPALATGAIILGAPGVSPEGKEITLTAFTAADAGQGGNLAYNWTVLKNGAEYATGTEGGITFVPDDEGTYVVLLKVTTTAGDSDTQSVSVAVTNVAPTAEIAGPTALAAGTAATFRATSNDPGTLDAQTYSWEVRAGFPDGALLATGSGSTFTYTPLAGGLQFVTVVNSDGDGGQSLARRVLIVDGGPSVASIVVTPNSVEGSPIRARASLGDLGLSEDSQFVWRVLKNGVAYAFTAPERGAIDFTPDDNGFYQVELTVRAAGRQYTASPKVVTVVNAAPTAAILGLPQTVAVGETVALTADVLDPGAADGHTVVWQVSGPDGTVVPGGTGSTFSFRPTAPGGYFVSLTVTDDDNKAIIVTAGGSSVSSFDGRVVVTRGVQVDAGGIAVAVVPPTGPFAEGGTYRFAATAPAGQFRYDWEVTDGSRIVAAGSSGGFVGSPMPFDFIPPDAGRYQMRLTVTATDGRIGVASSAVFDVANAAPVVTIAAPGGPYYEGEAIPLTLTASDPGGPAPVFVRWRVNGVDQMPDATDPRKLAFVPPDEGVSVVEVVARDSRGATTTESLSLTVLNRPPKVTVVADPAGTAADGSTVGLAARVLDADPPALAEYAWTVQRNGSVIASGTAPNISFSTAGGGTFVATLAVTDEPGGDSTTVTTLVVTGGAGDDTIEVTQAQLNAVGATQLLVQGLGGDDTIMVEPGVTVGVVLDGGAGDDTLTGGGGDDVLYAGTGNNVLSGLGGNDLLVGGGNDDLHGGDGDDYYAVHFSAVRLYETGDGADTIDLDAAPQGVTFDLGRQGVAQDVFAGSTLEIHGGFETLIGTGQADYLSSDVVGSVVQGGGGDDVLAARGEGVRIDGGAGNDTLNLDGDGNRGEGGDGTDVFTFDLGATNAVAVGGTGDDFFSGYAGVSTTLFAGAGIDTVNLNGGTHLKVYGRAGVLGGTDTDVFGDAAAAADGALALTVQNVADVDIFGTAAADTLTFVASADVDIFGGNGGRIEFDRVTTARLRGEFGDALAASPTGVTLVATASSDIDIFGTATADTLVFVNTQDVDIFGAAGDLISLVDGRGFDIHGGFGDALAAAQPLTITAVGTADIDIFGTAAGDTLTLVAAQDVDIFGSAGAVIDVRGGRGIRYNGEFGDAAAVTPQGVTLTATGVADIDIFGTAAADTLTLRASQDIDIYGGARDLITLTDSAHIRVAGEFGDAAAVAPQGVTLTATGVADIDIFGTAGADTLTLVAALDVDIFGGLGDWVTLDGGSRARFVGGFGDALAVDGTGALVAGATLTVSNVTDVDIFGTAGADTIALVAVVDVDIYSIRGDALQFTDAVGVRISGGFGDAAAPGVGGATLTFVASADVDIFGTAAADTLTFVASADVDVFGGGGDDVMTADGGADYDLHGDDGADRFEVNGDLTGVVGGRGGDIVVVTGGNTVFVLGYEGDDDITVLGGTNVAVFGNEGDDSVRVDGPAVNVVAAGGAGSDMLTATAGTSVFLIGGTGGDTIATDRSGTELYGLDGNDTIEVTGGASDVRVSGDEGEDTLTSSGGLRVVLSGGAGRDVLTILAGSQSYALGGADEDAITLASTGDHNVIFAGEGDDQLVGSAGTDGLLGGDAGDDTITLTGGTRLYGLGGAGNDKLATGVGGVGNHIYGEAGADELTVTGGTDVVAGGGSGDDTLLGQNGTNVILFGNSGDDTGTVSSGVGVVLSGGTGDDSLTAASGSADLYGDDGDDTYVLGGQGAADVRVKELLVFPDGSLEGPARGSDSLDLSAFGAATLDLSLLGWTGDAAFNRQGAASGLALTLFGSFENITGTAGADILLGNAGANRLIGGGGDDIIRGFGGDDVLEGGGGNDTLEGGTGNDTYTFDPSAAPDLGSDTVVEADGAGTDTLDFAAFGAAAVIDLGSLAAQAVGGTLTVTLSNPSGTAESAVENVVGTAFDDTLTGNALDNTFTGGTGDDTLSGLAGNDTYVFTGAGLGSDAVIEAEDADSDTLDFTGFDAPLALDLGRTDAQPFGTDLTLTLSGGRALENVFGTGYADRITGNARANNLIGAGGPDVLVGGDGDDYLQAGFTQVVYLDFATNPGGVAGEFAYSPTQREAIVGELERIFAAFDYRFTLDPAVAGQWAARQGGRFVTLTFNDGPGGGIGGEAGEVDFRNLTHGNTGTVNVNTLLNAGDYAPEVYAQKFVALTATVAAHELGHMAGLRHGDAFGPVGSGIYPGLAPRYLPEYGGPADAVDTPRHVMASPLALGTPLADATAPVALGTREAIKLAFNETGLVVREGQRGRTPTRRRTTPRRSANYRSWRCQTRSNRVRPTTASRSRSGPSPSSAPSGPARPMSTRSSAAPATC